MSAACFAARFLHVLLSIALLCCGLLRGGYACGGVVRGVVVLCVVLHVVVASGGLRSVACGCIGY